jgi:hypothetical protein
MLNEGLKRESTQIAYFEKMFKDCDEPDIKKFARELADEHKIVADRIVEKLNIIRSKAGVLDEIIDSYES